MSVTLAVALTVIAVMTILAAAVIVNVWQARGGRKATARETLLVPVWWAEPADDTAGGGPVNEFSHTGTKRRRGAAGLARAGQA